MIKFTDVHKLMPLAFFANNCDFYTDFFIDSFNLSTLIGFKLLASFFMYISGSF